MRSGLIGAIATPAQGNRIGGLPEWVADNGCFGKGYPGDDGFLAWLESLRPHAASCRFAVAPDVVGDAAATLARSAPFLPAIRAMGYPVALAAQNGLERLAVPWDDFDVLFLGGSAECAPCGYVRPFDLRDQTRCPACHRVLREWKLGVAARALVAEASARGKWVHMGRVNSLRRYRYASAIGCTSVDGTFLAFGPDINLPKLLGWVSDARGQMTLFGPDYSRGQR